MRTLALEMSTVRGSMAVLQDGRVVASQTLTDRKTTTQAFAPAMDQLLQSAGWRPRDVGLVAVSTGPGSFTGLRVAVTTAKTFAYAVGAEVIGVNTLDVMAHQVAGEFDVLHCVLDAQRRQLFWAEFRRDGRGEIETATETQVIDVDGWLQRLAGDGRVAVSGPGLAKVASRLPAHVQVVDRQAWTPRAATVGQVGVRRYLSGEREDIWKLVPQYYRLSAAEEKLRST